MQRLRDRQKQKGQGMVELALILCLVALVALVSLQLLGTQLMLTYQDIQEAVVNSGDAGSQAAYTCPDGTPAVLHGHKYHCH